ncbi:MAG: hypothetical protein E6G44_11690 [Actinobacteria bacterium]|nr:MAG: hypothetical protein E6G44_11690 [Actinomycetota bacterium]
MSPYTDEGPISEEELAQNRLYPVLERWRASLGDRLAGDWLEWWRSPTVNVAIREPSADEVSILSREAAEIGWEARIVPARHTASELQDFTKRATALIARRQPDALISAGPDPSTNKIYVVLREPDRSLIEELYRSLPQDVMILSIESGTWTSYVPLA